jgi:hypothetical protein
MTINAHDAVPQIHVPHHKCAGREIVGAFGGHGSLGGRAEVFFAANLHGKRGRALDEFFRQRRASPERDIRTERSPVRQVHDESDVVGQRDATAGTSCVLVQARIDLASREPVHAAGWCHQHQLAIDELRFAVFRDSIQRVDGACVCATHSADRIIVGDGGR